MDHSSPVAPIAFAVALAVFPVAAASGMQAAEELLVGSADVSIVTPSTAPSLAAGSVVIRIGGGALDNAVADQFDLVTETIGGRYDTLIVRLDSAGGSSGATQRIVRRIETLARDGLRLRTMVHQGDTCASACILVFLAAQERYAGNASSWGFHGAALPGSNVPVPWATTLFIDGLKAGGVAAGFIEHLEQTVYLSIPGVYWLSGYEVSVVHQAGIITHLIPAWQPEYARYVQPSVGLGSR